MDALRHVCDTATLTLAAAGAGLCVMARDGVRAVFSFPMQIGAARLGVLDVIRASAGALAATELNRADARRRAFGEAVERGAELFQAQGVVMIQLDGTLAEAMTRIRAYAYAEDRRLGDVAADVLAHRLRFGRDHP